MTDTTTETDYTDLMTADELNDLMARTHLGNLLDLTDPTHTKQLLPQLIDAMVTAIAVDEMLAKNGCDFRRYRVISEVCKAIIVLHSTTEQEQVTE